MEFFAHMTFLFLGGLFFLIGFALCIHFDVYGIKTRVNNWFLSIFHVVLPDDNDANTKELKLKMAKAATFIAYAVFFVLLVSIFLSFAVPVSLSEGENKYTGPLGDLFNGLLTPLLTFLTFCGLLITIMIQNVQMKSTLKELDLTRKEAEKSNSSMEKQLSNSESQKTDQYFFSLLEHHKSIVNDLNNKAFISNCFLYNEKQKPGMFEFYFNIFSKYKDWSFPYITRWLMEADNMLPFFLINFNLLSWVDKNISLKSGGYELSNFEKGKSYTNILRATLTRELLLLIFINIAIGKFDKYKKLVEKYELLEHLELKDIELKIFILLFSRIDCGAFGDKVRLIKYLDYHWTVNDKLSIIICDNFLNKLKVGNEANRNDFNLIKIKLHEFVRLNYDFDFVKNNLHLFKLENLNEFLALKEFTVVDVINYEVVN